MCRTIGQAEVSFQREERTAQGDIALAVFETWDQWLPWEQQAESLNNFPASCGWNESSLWSCACSSSKLYSVVEGWLHRKHTELPWCYHLRNTFGAFISNSTGNEYLVISSLPLVVFIIYLCSEINCPIVLNYLLYRSCFVLLVILGVLPLF